MFLKEHYLIKKLATAEAKHESLNSSLFEWGQ